MVLDRFCQLFNELDKGNLQRLQEIYSEDIRFQDPFSRVEGLDAPSPNILQAPTAT
jgi:hypothetical protein